MDTRAPRMHLFFVMKPDEKSSPAQDAMNKAVVHLFKRAPAKVRQLEEDARKQKRLKARKEWAKRNLKP